MKTRHISGTALMTRLRRERLTAARVEGALRKNANDEGASTWVHRRGCQIDESMMAWIAAYQNGIRFAERAVERSRDIPVVSNV